MQRPDDHELPGSPEGRGPLRRLLRYARPYLALMALTLVLGGLLSGSHFVRAYLMKPVFDDIILPGAQLEKDTTQSFGWPQLPGFRDEASAPAEAVALEDSEQRALLEGIRDSMERVLWIALALVLVTPVLLFSREYTVQYVLGRIDLDMKIEVCNQLLALPLRFHHERQRGDIMQRILNDATRAQSALGLLFGDFLQAVLMIGVGVVHQAGNPS